MTLDGGDTDPARFWSHVVAALATVEPRVVPRAGRLVDVALPQLFDELSDVGPHLVLVLDDYHRAETRRSVRSWRSSCGTGRAASSSSVSTRSDPALGVPTLRASGGLVELRSDDLRFDDAEFSQFFDGIGVTGLTAEEERRLADRTGGWPAPSGSPRC